ncbi:MICAL-like protein 1 isoform X2 [Monomorium pharaonis]|nr:MICAL-like protein 1 isoform X2 [Monomorium pharaonis]
MRRDPCAACGLPVFLAEKLLIARAPYHRTCFRCARCCNQLTPGNYYETEEGQYCCETCPDEEEETDSARHGYAETAMSHAAEREKSRPLSDEEKTERKGVLENAAVPDLISHTSQMRKSFMTSQLLSEKLDDSVAKDTRDITIDSDREKTKSRIGSAFPDDDENEEEDEENDDDEEEEEEEEESRSSVTDSPEESNIERYNVHSALNSLNIRSDEDQRSTAISFHDIGGKKRSEEDTKESPGRAGERANPETKLSLVQMRLQMFEARDKRDHVDGTDRNKQRSPVVQGDSWDLSPDVVLPVNEEETKRPEKRLEEDSIIKNINCTDSFENVGKQQKENSKITSSEQSEENFSKDIVWANNEESLDKGNPLESSSKVKSIERQKESFAKIEDERIESNKINEECCFKNIVGSSVLTAKGINLSDNEDYPEDLNPFKSDEEGNVVEDKLRTVINSSRDNKVSTNPFDSEDEDVEEPEPPRPAARSKQENQETSVTKRVLAAPQINLNPFWSDDEEEHGSDEERRDRTPPGNLPVPKPRTIKTTPDASVVSRRVDLDRGGVYASNSSLTSSESTTTPGGTYKKKKPAPQPPVAKELFPTNQRESPTLKSYNSTSVYQDSSSRTTLRTRKTKPAPPPPMPTSTPSKISIGTPSFDESPIIKLRSDDRSLNMWEDQKTNKDEANRNRQSLSSVSCTDTSSYTSYVDKSVQGKWKRKKGPAPPRPIPHKRKIKVISMKDVKLELDEIELQQQGLERQGVRLEQLIRDKCESGPRTDDSSLDAEVEELVLELFALVNEKNELFRRQAELMLLRRQQRLEEEHVEVEYQIRCLMCQPEATKTDFEKQREETLIQRLVEIVERRNEIVECLEMDRRREVEEDRSINKHMGLFAARNKNGLSGKDNDSSNVGKTKKGKKEKKEMKEKKLKKTTKKDADKDVDETEVKLKRHGKRRWF